jgi:hypothetical protein
MNPQITASLIQARQSDFERSAAAARMVSGLRRRPNRLTTMLRSIIAPRLSLRAMRAQEESWNAISQA